MNFRILNIQCCSDENRKLNLEQQIVGGVYDFPLQDWFGISADAKDLVKKLLTVDPNKRYTLSQVLEHPWIKNDHEMKASAHKLMYPESLDQVSTENSGMRRHVYANEDTNGADAINETSGVKKRCLRDDSSSSSFFFDGSRDDNRTKKLREYHSNSTDKST